MIVKDCKRWLKSLAGAWIDYRKAYDMVPHSLMQKYMELFRVAVNVRSFVNTSMKQWNTGLTASNQKLVNLKIRHGTLQGDSLSPLIFVLVMKPFTLVLRQKRHPTNWRKEVRKLITYYLWMIWNCLWKMKIKQVA